MNTLIDWWEDWILFLPLHLGEKQPYKIVRLLCLLFFIPWLLVFVLTTPITLALILIDAIGGYVNA